MGLIGTAALRREMLSCTQCAALVQCRSRVVPGAGAVPAVIAFVGLAPGRFGGDLTGVPFTGDRSGVLLRRMIHQAGLRRVFITNLVRCNPRDSLGRNRDPDASELANCRDFLEAELNLARPAIIACLGRVAWRELAGRAAPFDPQRPAPIQVGGRLLYPLYHPAYVNRGALSQDTYREQFRALRRVLQKMSHEERRLSIDDRASRAA